MTKCDDQPDQPQPGLDLNETAELFQETPVKDLCEIIADPSSELVQPWTSEQRIEAAIQAKFEETGLPMDTVWARANELSVRQGLGEISYEEVEAVLSGSINAEDTHPWYTIAQVIGADVGGLQTPAGMKIKNYPSN